MEYAELPEESKYPALLCPNHDVTSMIVNYCHQRIGHGGVNYTFAELRSKFG